MKNYIVKYAEVGPDAGPFTITDSTGAVVATGVTRAQLLEGYMVSINDTATGVTVTSASPCGNSTVLEIPAAIGYLNYPGTTHVDTWVTNNQEILTSRTPTAAATIGALQYYTIVESGVLAGAQPLTVAGPATSLGPFNGGGTVVMTATNTLTGAATVQTGATLQLGANIYATSGSLATNTTTIQAGGTVNVVGADATSRPAIGAVVNNGSLNFTGTEVCGMGYFRNNGAFTNTGLLTIDDAKFQFVNTTTFGIGNGTILVKDGATLDQNSVNLPASQILQLNGCGKCNASGIQQGALLYGVTTTIASPIVLQSEVCMKAAGAGTTTFSGKLTGSSKLTLGNSIDSTSSKYGVATFTNATNEFTGALDLVGTSMNDNHPLAFQYSDVRMIGVSYISSTQAMTFKSLASDSTTAEIVTWANPITLTDNGVTTFAGLIKTSSAGFNAVTIDGASSHMTFTNPGNHTAGFRILDGAKMSFIGGGQLGDIKVENGSKFTVGKTTTGYVYTGGVTMTGNSILEVQAVSPTQAGLITVYGAFDVTGGYKVDLVEPMSAGTYNILRAVGGGTGAGIIPTLGVNNTGLTPTFSWSGQYLRVTLA